MLARGMASNHLLVRSMMVKRYRNPSHAVGSSPMKSTWMCEKPWVGTGMGCCAAGGWRTTLARLHCWQSATHLCTSLFTAGPHHPCSQHTAGCLDPWVGHVVEGGEHSMAVGGRDQGARLGATDVAQQLHLSKLDLPQHQAGVDGCSSVLAVLLRRCYSTTYSPAGLRWRPQQPPGLPLRQGAMTGCQPLCCPPQLCV
jgi:hypothetical protein